MRGKEEVISQEEVIAIRVKEELRYILRSKERC
jgi:hypothetical protein